MQFDQLRRRRFIALLGMENLRMRREPFTQETVGNRRRCARHRCAQAVERS
jgi:hypothetical protein